MGSWTFRTLLGGPGSSEVPAGFSDSYKCHLVSRILLTLKRRSGWAQLGFLLHTMGVGVGRNGRDIGRDNVLRILRTSGCVLKDFLSR
jgi:hypothetical protein